MKQPALGQKISELRKSKGLTQEELVEQCNISVRTIQRIEAGEVTPRSYTIKTILSALDYDLEEISTETPKITQEFKKLFLLEIDDQKEANFLTKQLTIAWIAGVVYFLLGFAEFGIEYSRYFENYLPVHQVLYIALKIIILVSIILFTRGFILTANIFKNYLLKVTSFMLICIGCLFYIYDILSLYLGKLDFEMIMAAEAITYGIVGVLFGISILRLKVGIGQLATVTGIFEIITYTCMITVILALAGFVLLTPTILLEIIVLYKVSAMLRAKQKEMSLT